MRYPPAGCVVRGSGLARSTLRLLSSCSGQCASHCVVLDHGAAITCSSKPGLSEVLKHIRWAHRGPRVIEARRRSKCTMARVTGLLSSCSVKCASHGVILSRHGAVIACISKLGLSERARPHRESRRVFGPRRRSICIKARVGPIAALHVMVRGKRPRSSGPTSAVLHSGLGICPRTTGVTTEWIVKSAIFIGRVWRNSPRGIIGAWLPLASTSGVRVGHDE